MSITKIKQRVKVSVQRRNLKKSNVEWDLSSEVVVGQVSKTPKSNIQIILAEYADHDS